MPVTVIVAGDVPPSGSTVGVSIEIVGAGFITVRSTGVPDPLVCAPLSAMTERCAALANCEAATVAVT